MTLFKGAPDPERTVLEIGVSMTVEAIAAVRDRLPKSIELVNHIYDDLMFGDPFGYRWHIWPEGEAFKSNGELTGRWLDI